MGMEAMLLTDMTAFDVYAVIMLAIFNGVWLPVVFWRIYRSDSWLAQQKAIFVIAGIGLWVAPLAWVATSVFSA